MIKPTDPAFPDDTNHIGIDVLTYVATHIAVAIRTSARRSQLNETDLAEYSVRDAKALIERINKETSPKYLQGSTA